MNASHAIPELDRRGLRRFGVLTGTIVAGLFGLVLPLVLRHPWPLWPWALLAVLAGLGLTVPGALQPVYKGWMRFGLLASRITTPLILGIVFFLVISPIGLIRRLAGRDAMARAFDQEAASYRIESVRKDAKSLERPF